MNIDEIKKQSLKDAFNYLAKYVKDNDLPRVLAVYTYIQYFYTNLLPLITRLKCAANSSKAESCVDQDLNKYTIDLRSFIDHDDALAMLTTKISYLFNENKRHVKSKDKTLSIREYIEILELLYVSMRLRDMVINNNVRKKKIIQRELKELAL